MPSSGNWKSWAGKREGECVQCKLDRSFGYAAWFSLFPRVHSIYMEMIGLDHRPLLTRLADEATGFRGRFFFFIKDGVVDLT